MESPGQQFTEAAFHQSNERLRIALKSVPITLFSQDQDLRYTWVHNPVFGYQADEILGKRDRDLLPPDDAEALETLKQSVLDSGKGDRREISLCVQGNAYYYDLTLEPLYNDRHCIVGISGAAVDVTHHKQTEQALSQQETLINAIFDSAPMGMAYLDCNLRYIHVNEALAKINGIPVEAHLNRTVDEVLPDWAAKLVPMLHSVMESRSPLLNMELIGQATQSGQYCHCLVNFFPIMLPDGQVIGIGVTSVDITELKQVEQALRESQERLRVALEAANMGTWRLDVATNLETRGSGLNALLGLPSTESVQPLDDFLARIHPEDRDRVLDITQQAIANHASHDIEYRVVRLDGEERWFLDKGNVVVDPEGVVEYLTGACLDITDRKQIEQALHDSEARFRGVLESNLIGILFWTLDGYLTDANQVACEMLGYTRDEFQSHQVRWPDITPPEYQEMDAAIIDQLQASGSCAPFEKEYIRKDGTRILVMLGCAVLSSQDGSGVAFMLDIRDRRQAEITQKILAEAGSILVSSLDYETTLSSIAKLLVPTLADLCFFDLILPDGSLQRVAAHHRDQDKAAWFRQIQEFAPTPDDPHHPVNQVLQQRKGQIDSIDAAWIQTIAQTPEHQHMIELCCPTSVITVPLIARDRKLGALTLAFTSESHRTYTERDLAIAEQLATRVSLAIDNSRLYQQAQDANRIKDEFLAVLSHELRSPLNPILGWSQLLRTRNFDAEITQRALETIERNAKLQTQLIDDLLDVSRILRGKLILDTALVDLASVVQSALETVQLAAEAKQIQIHTQLIPNANVIGDSSRLQQVVWNLLSNAVKFTPAGGQVTLILETVDQEAQLTVQDTGAGIPSDFLPHVFEYFRQADGATTRKFGGLGLGLAIVRHITELHGGMVAAASLGEDQGASFTVRIPLAPIIQTAPSSVGRSGTLPSLMGICVLGVDDEADMRDLIACVLEEYGAEVTMVDTAMSALECLPRLQPDILVSDIGMPDVDGYALIRQVRSRSTTSGGNIPAIALTAYAGEANQHKAYAAGFQMHLAKPIEPEELVRTISYLVRLHRQS